MSSKRRSRAFDLGVYVLVRSVLVVIQLIPTRLAITVAEIVGWLAYHINKRHRLVATDNIRHAFPNYGEAEVDNLVRATYRHLFTMAVETAQLLRVLRPSNAGEYVSDANDADRDYSWGLFYSGKPIIVMTGHFGNWEALNLGLAMRGGHGAIVARALDNPYLDQYIRRVRESNGMRIIDKSGAATDIVEVLGSGGIVGLVGDQDAGAKGMFVDFFGRPASTFKSIALLALRYDAPILVLGCVRTSEPLKHVVILEDAILPIEYQKKTDAVRLITQRYTSALERLVRRHPEQYFWLHRRWKHQPPVKKAKLAA